MRYAVAIASCLAVHVACALWVWPWSDVVLAAGGLFVHNTDIASLPETVVFGLLLTAPVPIIVAIGLVRVLGRTARKQ